MSRNSKTMLPLIKKDFNKAVDRRKEERAVIDSPFELVFRDITSDGAPRLTEKSRHN
jgi:hypothetical protein